MSDEQSEMDDPTFKNFLIEQLIKNIGLKRPEAKYEATSMIEKKRMIQDTQYAVLEVDNIDDVKYYYYKRENNRWIRDESIPDNSFFGTNELFCNIQKKCIQINKKCAEYSFSTDLMKKDFNCTKTCADNSLGTEMIKKELINSTDVNIYPRSSYSKMLIWHDLFHVAVNNQALIYSEDISKIILEELEH